MAKDLWGLPLSTESPGAAEQYVLAVEKLLSANAGAEEALGRAIDADPGFAVAHAARARVLQLRGAMPEARAAAARAALPPPSPPPRPRPRGRPRRGARAQSRAGYAEHARPRPRAPARVSARRPRALAHERRLRPDRLQRPPRPQRSPARSAGRSGRLLRRGLVVPQSPTLRP